MPRRSAAGRLSKATLMPVGYMTARRRASCVVPARRPVPMGSARPAGASGCRAMASTSLQESVWAAVPADVEPYELERRRAFLAAHVHPGQTVLDLGCGAGAFTAMPADWGIDAVGVDVATEALRRARTRHPE